MQFRKEELVAELKKRVEQEEKRWELEKPLLEREQKVNSEKEEFAKKKNKLTTSKILIGFLFLNCTLIEIFTGWAMIKMLYIASIAGTSIDFTPLVALIGAVVGEVIGYGIYSLKSAKENSVGGLVFESAMKDKELESKKKAPAAEGGLG